MSDDETNRAANAQNPNPNDNVNGNRPENGNADAENLPEIVALQRQLDEATAAYMRLNNENVALRAQAANANNPQPRNIPVIPPAQIIHHEALSHMRKYDGKTSVNDYLKRLSADLTMMNLGSHWILTNLDRLMQGDAKAWWSSQWPAIDKLMSQPNADFNVIWNNAKDKLTSFFDHSSQRSVYRARNSALVYMMVNDPQTYVSKKIEILSLLNSNMSEEDKVRHLREGLPQIIADKLAPLQLLTTDEFLFTLRRTVENLSKFDTSNSRQSSASSLPVPSTFMGKTQAEFPGNQTNTFINSGTYCNDQPVLFGNQHRTAEGVVICDWCNNPGHTKNRCRNKQNGYPPHYAKQTHQINTFALRNNPYPRPQGYAQGGPPRYNSAPPNPSYNNQYRNPSNYANVTAGSSQTPNYNQGFRQPNPMAQPQQQNAQNQQPQPNVPAQLPQQSGNE